MRHAVTFVSAVNDDMRASERAAHGSGTRQVTQDQPMTGLPTPTTPFVGRVEELEQVESLLADPRVRLVTLLGPGGTGKTRLALAAADRAQTSFSDGVYFVPLSSVSTVAGITERVADVLALREDPRATLGNKRVLLVLDNFEHLSAHAGWVAETLGACPRVVIMTTSREALNLSNEWVLPVDGLSFPAEAVGAADADRYDAVRLFELRARQLQPNFDLRAEFTHVARICHLVEGLPLALELAAAWLRTLSPREIAAEIQHNLNILQTKYRDVAARHRSLDAVFEQSWRLLTDSEQKAFKRLAIFPGGFSRDAAGSVARINFASLDTLIDKSLVRRRGEDRYEIHELLRQFGEARLEESSEEHRAVLTQCSAYYATFLDRQTKNFGEMRGAVRLSQLGQEIGNIQRALNYLLSQQRVAEIGGSLTALCYLYQQAGWLGEGEQDFAHIVDRLREFAPSRGRTLALSRALTGLAWWRHCRDQHGPAIQLLEEGLTLLAEAQSPAVDRGLAHLYQGRARCALGDHAGSSRTSPVPSRTSRPKPGPTACGSPRSTQRSWTPTKDGTTGQPPQAHARWRPLNAATSSRLRSMLSLTSAWSRSGWVSSTALACIYFARPGCAATIT
jgi:predicted ATPase